MISIFEMRELVHDTEEVEMTLAGNGKKPRSLPIYGLMAEFDGPEALLEAARRSFAEGYRRMDAYSPFPIDGLAEAIGFHKTRLAFDCSDRRHYRMRRRILLTVLGFGDRLSAEHRRAPFE